MAIEIVVQGDGKKISNTDASPAIIPPPTMQRIMNVVGESPQNREILRQVVGNVLSTYGQPVMTTILWHLNAKGVVPHFGADMDISKFHKALQQIAGDLADMILNEICADLDRACHDRNLDHPDLVWRRANSPEISEPSFMSQVPA